MSRTYPETNRREGGTFLQTAARSEDAGVVEAALRQGRATQPQEAKMSSLPTRGFGIGSITQRQIEKRINKEISEFSNNINKFYPLNSISGFLSKKITNFILGRGKHIRPILFVIGYLGFTKAIAPGLYRSALSIELLHNFMLIHDDIIDKSETRRGKPSMHKGFDNYLEKYPGMKFDGKDMAIVIGDVIYAMAIDVFLTIKENPVHKEKALKKFIEAAIFTGGGEFIELLYGINDIGRITKQDIYKIYKFKTAYYTFVCPLSIGAALAGVSNAQLNIISQYGLYLGMAFQIKDDILGIFSEEKKTGKSPFIDLQEGKKTILLWYAYNHSDTNKKSIIKTILSKQKISESDLFRVRKIVTESGALNFAEGEISRLLKKTSALVQLSTMRASYKNLLCDYIKKIFPV